MTANMRRTAAADHVHIVATGVRCAVGLNAASAGAAIRGGVSRIREHPFLMDRTGEKIYCALEPSIALDVDGPDRIARLAATCLADVADRLTSLDALPLEMNVLLSLPEPRPGFTQDQARKVVNTVAATPIQGARSIRVQPLGFGHAGPIDAVRVAAQLVATGKHELLFVIGSDSYLTADTIAWLDEQKLLAREEFAGGFHPGEGAALIAVANARTSDRLRLRSLGLVRGVGCAQERRNPKSDEGVLGEALASAVETATEDLRLPEEAITDTYGDINGELIRNEDWGFAALRTASRFHDATTYVTAVGECGDVGAATPMLGCVLATESWAFKCAAGPRALVWSGSWSGLRGAVVLEQQTA